MCCARGCRPFPGSPAVAECDLAAGGVSGDQLGDVRRHAVGETPVGGRVPQVVQRSVRSQRCAGPGEHPVGGMVGQRPERAAQRPPQRLVPAGRHQAGRLRLIQPQPHERIRRGRHRLQRLGALRTMVISCWPGSASPRWRRAAGCAHPDRHPERHGRPVPMRAQRREQLAELVIRDMPRPAPDQLRPVQTGALGPEQLHQVPVRGRAPTTAPRQRERVHHRPGSGLQAKLVEPRVTVSQWTTVAGASPGLGGTLPVTGLGVGR